MRDLLVLALALASGGAWLFTNNELAGVVCIATTFVLCATVDGGRANS